MVPVKLGSARPSPVDAGGLHVVARGVDEAERARTKIGDVLDSTGIRDGARVRFTSGACAGPALVQVNLRVHGAPARIQVAGPSASVALDRAATRLERQIRRLTTTFEPWPWPDPQRRSLGLPSAGAIARHKQYPLLVGSPCQASAFMNAMDYDVMLYTDAETGEDAVVYRSGPTGLRLARQRSMRPPSMPVTLPLTVNAHRIPTLAPAAAARWLADGWLPHVFFTDAASGRGALLYRRYDGDLGLITAA